MLLYYALVLYTRTSLMNTEFRAAIIDPAYCLLIEDVVPNDAVSGQEHCRAMGYKLERHP